MRAEDVSVGDVVQAEDGTVYTLMSHDEPGLFVWGGFEPIGFYGPPFMPAGDLRKLVPEP